ncbi:MAG: hypothetical protein JWP98_643 [Edaphobacter sp.]|nr:hypothetical protein [Edaphobacter sp.]
MMKIRKAVLIAPLLMVTSILPVAAQNRNYRDNRNPNFNNGVRNGGRGGQYYDNRNYNNDRNRNNDRYYNDRNRNQGGIGPGKGALIGAGGGAVLGALFGGGLKGTIIGGAAGAGIGAVVGQAHQNSQRNKYYDRGR